MKNLFLVFLLLQSIVTMAQKNEKFIVRSNLGYNYSYIDHYDLRIISFPQFGSYTMGEKNRRLILNFTSGYKIANNFYAGLGLQYTTQRNEINPDESIQRIMDYPGSGWVSGYYNTVKLSKMISPMVYFEYFTKISSRWIVLLNINGSYDFFDYKETSEYHDMPGSPDSGITINRSWEHQIESFRIGLQPSVRFNIVDFFGLELVLGRIEYGKKVSDSRLENVDPPSEEFQIDFKPSNWLFGVFFVF